MQRVTVEDVPSRSYRGLEAFMFVPVVLGGLFALGASLLFVFGFSGGSTAGAAGTGGATGAGGGVAALIGGVATMWLLALLFGLASAITVPLFLYFDARKVASQDLEWEPSQGLYALGGFFLSGLVVWHYLYKRHQYVVDWVGSEAWWYLALIGVGIGVLGVAGSVIGPGLMFVGFAGVPLFAIGLYKDATYVRLNSDWRPNPVNHFLGALFTGITVVFAIPYFGYYVYKRHTNVGLV
ncbi:hypothetical protein [Halosimplex pelagicum]|uniref:Uncharacterized protein n=1 Tax=Halosimplex pelagicum TaxID=869886 RepID=A0A7D5TC60_9EURY|nr:hypothetical protein [Halosimplex pelagicum]QLH82773.1 hypothetical protein HZS54_14585 [Halosimplex pelagicum]